jgi:hypothetical protein
MLMVRSRTTWDALMDRYGEKYVSLPNSARMLMSLNVCAASRRPNVQASS